MTSSASVPTKGLYDRTSDAADSRVDRFLRTACILSLCAIVFVGGAIVVAADVTPGRQIAQAFYGGKALYDKLTRYQDVYASDLWQPERTPAMGVTVSAPSEAQNGATQSASGHEAAAYLIDRNGRVLHKWSRPYSSVWNETAKVKKPQPGPFVYFRKVKMFDNGDLLAIYEGVGDTPYGYGMVKLDRNSHVLWRFLDYAHHDFDVGADGRIYVLTHDVSSKPVPDFGNLQSPRIDDFLVVLSPEGRELERIPLLESVAKSRYRHLLHTVSSYSIGDPLHTNDVDVIPRGGRQELPIWKTWSGPDLISPTQCHRRARCSAEADRLDDARTMDRPARPRHPAERKYHPF